MNLTKGKVSKMSWSNRGIVFGMDYGGFSGEYRLDPWIEGKCYIECVLDEFLTMVLG